MSLSAALLPRRNYQRLRNSPFGTGHNDPADESHTPLDRNCLAKWYVYFLSCESLPDARELKVLVEKDPLGIYQSRSHPES